MEHQDCDQVSIFYYQTSLSQKIPSLWLKGFLRSASCVLTSTQLNANNCRLPLLLDWILKSTSHWEPPGVLLQASESHSLMTYLLQQQVLRAALKEWPFVISDFLSVLFCISSLFYQVPTRSIFRTAYEIKDENIFTPGFILCFNKSTLKVS